MSDIYYRPEEQQFSSALVQKVVENLEDELCFDAREPGLRVTVLGPLARLGP